MSRSTPWDWHAPLDGDLAIDGRDIDLEIARHGTFERAGGTTGWRPAHPDASLRAGFDGWSDGSAGTVTAWFCPLEAIGSRHATSDPDREANRRRSFPIVADAYPASRAGEATLAVEAWPRALCALEARAFNGHRGYLVDDVGGGEGTVVPADYRESERPRARVQVSGPPFRRGRWYHVGIGWDREAARIELYLNGELANAADGYAFDEPGDALYFGNLFVALADLRASDGLVGPEAVRKAYEADLERADRAVGDASDATHGTEPTPHAPDRDGYELRTSLSLTDPEEVASFTQLGPDSMPLAELRATPEGMLFETRDTWDVENLCTLWGPDSYEGDLLLECDVRVERDDGLALLAFDATTFDRGDVLDHRDFELTGSMKTHLFQMRNYWWEWLRHTPVVRRDRRDHVIAKGPYLSPPLGHNVVDVPEVDEWHTLTVHRSGHRIRCAIDGRCVLDARDPPFTGTGPTYNAGRIAIRHMQKTRVRYRDLKVWTRPAEGPDGDSTA